MEVSTTAAPGRRTLRNQRRRKRRNARGKQRKSQPFFDWLPIEILEHLFSFILPMDFITPFILHLTSTTFYYILHARIRSMIKTQLYTNCQLYNAYTGDTTTNEIWKLPLSTLIKFKNNLVKPALGYMSRFSQRGSVKHRINGVYDISILRTSTENQWAFCFDLSGPPEPHEWKTQPALRVGYHMSRHFHSTVVIEHSTLYYNDTTISWMVTAGVETSEVIFVPASALGETPKHYRVPLWEPSPWRWFNLTGTTFKLSLPVRPTYHYDSLVDPLPAEVSELFQTTLFHVQEAMDLIFIGKHVLTLLCKHPNFTTSTKTAPTQFTKQLRTAGWKLDPFQITEDMWFHNSQH